MPAVTENKLNEIKKEIEKRKEELKFLKG